MRFFSFFNTVKNQRFEFKPQHYDPTKEDLKNRLKMSSDEQSHEVTKLRIQHGLRSKSRGNQKLETDLNKRSNLRLLVILVILIFISYHFLTSEIIQNFIQNIG